MNKSTLPTTSPGTDLRTALEEAHKVAESIDGEQGAGLAQVLAGILNGLAMEGEASPWPENDLYVLAHDEIQEAVAAALGKLERTLGGRPPVPPKVDLNTWEWALEWADQAAAALADAVEYAAEEEIDSLREVGAGQGAARGCPSEVGRAQSRQSGQAPEGGEAWTLRSSDLRT